MKATLIIPESLNSLPIKKDFFGDDVKYIIMSMSIKGNKIKASSFIRDEQEESKKSSLFLRFEKAE